LKQRRKNVKLFITLTVFNSNGGLYDLARKYYTRVEVNGSGNILAYYNMATVTAVKNYVTGP
jgi:hypothetical protein